MYRTALLIAASAIAAGAAAYKWQENSYELKLLEQETTYLKRDFRALENSHAETIRLQTRKEAAEQRAVSRERAAAADAATLRDSLYRLSDTADKALSDAGASITACTAHGATVTALFKDCAGRYSWMGGQAQGWLNEAMTLRESYPVNAKTPDLTAETGLHSSVVLEPEP